MAVVVEDDDELTFCIEFIHGVNCDSNALQLRSCGLLSQTHAFDDASGGRAHSATSWAANLSVKSFSRRRLLQTGGIATRVWTSSVLLARWMARHVSFMHIISQRARVASDVADDMGIFGSGGGRVLELGCGLGVAGIAAAMCGCRVLLTDIHSVALSACESAIRANTDRLQAAGSSCAFADGGRTQSVGDFLKKTEALGCSKSGQAFTMELDWNNLPELAPHERFSCIIAADVVHEEEHATLISSVIIHMLAPHGVCLLANPDACSRYGMDIFPRLLEEHGLQVKLLVPLPLAPPACGEDETQDDVLTYHMMVITRVNDAAVQDRDSFIQQQLDIAM